MQLQEFIHSLKLGETSKGLGISVHVYANDQEKAIEEGFNTCLKARMTAMDNKMISIKSLKESILSLET